jgi:hypothetical protein
MGLPPGNSKFSGDATPVTTFFWQFPNFTATHTGVTATVGINSVAGGGTGLSALTANNVILGNGTSSPTFVAPGSSGNILSSNGTTWLSTTPVGNSAFMLATSSVVNILITVSNTSFTTLTSNLLSFTPTISGTYKVYTPIAGQAAATGSTIFRVFNTSGSATLLSESQAYVGNNSAGLIDTAFVQSTYTLTSGTAYVFDIQGLYVTSPGFIRGDQAPFYMYAEGVGLSGGGGSGLTEAQVWARVSYGM